MRYGYGGFSNGIEGDEAEVSQIPLAPQSPVEQNGSVSASLFFFQLFPFNSSKFSY